MKYNSLAISTPANPLFQGCDIRVRNAARNDAKPRPGRGISQNHERHVTLN
jgi:hypothetical protein